MLKRRAPRQAFKIKAEMRLLSYTFSAVFGGHEDSRTKDYTDANLTHTRRDKTVADWVNEFSGDI